MLEILFGILFFGALYLLRRWGYIPKHSLEDWKKISKSVLILGAVIVFFLITILALPRPWDIP